MTLRVNLLAHFQISIDDQLIVPLSPRLQALVAYLALHRETRCSRRQVADALWPETNDEQALKNLRTQITRLRQSLPTTNQFLYISSDALQWRDGGNVALDIAQFSAAAHTAAVRRALHPAEAIAHCEIALSLYRGDLLPGWQEEWVLPLREQLRQEYLATLELAAAVLKQEQRFIEAIAAAQRWVRADPLNEAAYAQVMHLHLRQGDNSAALRIYQTAQAALREGLDIAPGALLEDLRRQAQASGGAPAVHTGYGGSASSATLARRDPAFVGRGGELRWLNALWQQCQSDGAEFAVLSGEAGIGKTRLAEEWLARLREQGVAVAATHCFAGGEGLAYAPLAELFRASLFVPRLQALGGVWLSEIARILPEVTGAGMGVSPPGPLTETWQRQRFLQALTRLVLGGPSGEPLARGAITAQDPQVLFIDDLQWCDGETLGWLAYLMHAAANSPLLILATIRSEDLRQSTPVLQFLLSLQRRGHSSEQIVGPLSPADTASLAAHVGGRPLSSTEARQLYQNTEGNPLFVVEVVRAWTPGTVLRAGALPPKMQAILRYRLAQLSAAAQVIVQAAAVAGHDFSLALLMRTGNLPEAETIAALDELWQHQIVRQVRPEHYEFGHDKLRQVAYEEISPERRRWLHGLVADTLVALHPGEVETLAGEIAQHFAHSSRPEAALDYCLLAANGAARMFANDEAIVFYQKAQSLLAPGDGRALTIHQALGELQQRQGNWQAAEAAYLAALDLLTPDDVLARAALLHKLSRTLIASHQRIRAAEALAAARSLLESAAIERSAAWHRVWIALLMGQIEWHYWGGSTGEMERLIEQLERPVREYGSPLQQMEWQQLAARAAYRRARYILSDAMVEERRAALAALQQANNTLELPLAQFGYAFTLLWNGRVQPAAVQFRAALLLARQMGIVLVETQCLTYLALIARLTGQIEEARDLTLLALESAQTSQRLDYVGMALANQAWLAWRAGDLPAARSLAETALANWEAAATGIPFRWLALWPLIGVALAEQRLDLALAYARELLDETQQQQPQHIRERVSAALAVWEAGYGVQARAHLEMAATAATALGQL